MVIRKAGLDDSVSIGSLVRSLADMYLQSTHSQLPGWFSETLSNEAFRTRMLNTDYQSWVYETDGGVVGYICLQNKSHLYHLFVAKSHQRMGIARCLWEHVVRHTNGKDITVRSSINAISVYNKLGFINVGEEGHKEGVCFQPMVYIRR